MATTWLPKNRLRSARQFLLTNGDVITEPDLEETSTGMKVRLAGETASHFKRDEEAVIRQGVDKIAASRKAQFWMPLDLDGSAMRDALGFTPGGDPVAFNPLGGDRTKARIWWSFKHKTLPIEAVVVVRWMRMNSLDASNAITVKVTVPAQGGNLYARAITVQDRDFDQVCNDLPSKHQEKFEDWLAEHPTSWLDLFEGRSGMIERDAVKALLDKVRAIDGLASIEIPDVSNPKRPKWLKLEASATNCNGQFIADMVEYLDGEVGVEKALATYRQLLDDLRRVGVIIESGLTGNQFMQAMLNGDDALLTTKITSSIQGDDGKNDPMHKLSVHLPTGTFVVSCSNAAPDEIAHRWEESVLLARLTGKEDELLAYATAYVSDKHAKNAKKIVNERKTALARH